MTSFFETIWFPYWLIAMIVVGRWCWITFLRDQDGNKDNSDGWKELYRSALLETDTAKMEQAVREAEGAILFNLASRLFQPRDSDTLELQDALNNLRALRESAGPPTRGNVVRPRSDHCSR